MSFEFNYKEDLVPRIRDLIDGYSKDSILKEYLQNADDSGATELVVTFDKRKHKGLIGSKFDAAKETSLLLYNNADFKESDFKAIVKISAQGKIEDAGSTGRFGQGFSSSFSISDHPSFVSSGRAYWFDVLRNAVSNGKEKSIQGWDLENDKNEISQWLITFNIENDQIGTTFRLPLRDTETASQSDISHEIFKYQDFLKWCDEWKHNTSGLLFLRYVKRLVLQEINEGGKKIIHLELSTKNSKEIHEYNKKLQEGFSAGLLNICEAWKEHDEPLPLFSYKHNFLITYFDRDKNSYRDFEESWAVVNGLFRGKDDHLIDQAIKVLNISPNPRKVLPWAGVAISLDKKGSVNKNIKSNYYTFLPLPIKSKHPVHVHGWFDLNPKRTEITYDGSGDDKNILIEWNRLLFKDGVGTAWAYLIDFIKKYCESQRYYSLWPKNHEDEFDEYLLEGFYKEIAKLQCFKTRYKEKISWETPKDNIYYFQNASNKKLFDAFKEHYSIISPKPTPIIIGGLSAIGTDLEEITPEFIRDYLNEQSEEFDFPIALKDMPIEMLSKKEWFLSILNYCAKADEGRDFSLLDGLPLELACDNKVTCLAENRLLDINPKLRIFENDESLFLHPEVLEIVKDTEALPSSWLEANLKNYLTVLHEHIDNYDRKNKHWLKSLVSMIARVDKSEIDEAIDELQELEIVYQHDGLFALLKSDSDSPVLISKEEVPNINYLIKIGMHLIHPEYIHIYEPLLKRNECELITEFNSTTLIKHLVRQAVNEYGFFEDRETREYLIDLLAQNISWMDELSTEEAGWLNDMPFIATESDNVFSKSDDIKLYLPAGFKPPKHILNLKGEYEIISIVDDSQNAMYKKMGFDEQNPINYLNQIIIPFIESLPSVDDVRKISEWLANNWEELTQDLDEDQKEDLISTLSESQIVIDSDSNLNIAKNYYHPDYFYDLHISLQDKKYLPLKFEDDSTQKKWSDLLAELGASKKIIPEHIVTTVQSIVEEDNDEKSIALLNYISNHFEWFEEMEFEEENIFQYLSDLAWLPAEKPKNDFLVPEDEYKKLHKPSELILKHNYMIAGGAHYSLSLKVKLGKKDEEGVFSEREIAKSIGLLVHLPGNSIFESLRRLQIHSSQKHELKVLQFAKEFYKYLGNSHIEKDDIPGDIIDKAVFIKGKWLSSSKVFQTSINLSGIFSWDELIAKDGKESSLAEGLFKLGVSEKPDNEYLINYLVHLPQNQKLNKQELKDAKAIFGQLQNNLEDIVIDLDDIPLLTRSDQLITCDQLYIKDLSAYDKSEKRNDKLEFCQQQFDKLAKQCGVISLADNLTPDVDLDNSQESSESDNTWKDYIRSDPFKSAVLRLIYHEGKIGDDDINQESIDEVLPSNVLLMDSLVVRYFIDDTWIYDDIGTPAHQDIENSTLYLLNQEDDEDISESIAKFICDSSDLKRDSFSLIGRILRHKYDTAKEIHNLLDKKNIKSLPEEIEIDENFSLFDNDVDSEEPEENFEVSTYNNSDEEQHSIDDSHSSTEDVAQDITNAPNKKQSPSLSGEEIPPPTKPKKSSSSNIKSKENSSDSHKKSGVNRSNEVNSFEGKGKNLSLNSNKKIVSSNDRKPVYVGKDKEIDSYENREQQNRATEIGNRGEQYVLEHSRNYLLSESNKFEKAPPNNEGYDISEIDKNGKIVRYIEVKALTGDWGEWGVGITVPQLEFAQVYDNWWLFVVENLNTDKTSVHDFKNPIQKANSFRFDCSWEQLAEKVKSDQSVSPIVGTQYKISGDKYEVSSFEKKGKLFKVKLKDAQTGKEVTKKFDPSWEKC
jgi:hypothetical protein